MKIIFYSGLFILLFTLESCQNQEKEEVTRSVRALCLEKETSMQLHTFPGRTRAVDRVNLSFRVHGPLVQRPVNVGDEVKKGDILAAIDPTDYEVELSNNEGQLEKAIAELRFAKSDYQRSLNIYEKDPGAISESFLDRKKEDVERLKGEVKSWKAKVKSSEDSLYYTLLISPFDGIVVATFVENYEFVRAKQPVVRLLNNSQIEMVIDIPESLIAKIPHIKGTYLILDTYPYLHFPAQIKEIGTEASLVTRTYPITLSIEQPKGITIFPGMVGKAILVGGEKEAFEEEGFLLPSTAVFTDNRNQNTYVWIVDPDTNKVFKQEVSKGKLFPNGILIVRGLQAQQWVVTSGVYSLEEGQKVRILPVILGSKGEVIEFSEQDIELLCRR